MRIGHGYDVHRLASGRDLIIGGVKIEFEFGLEAHSDGDVLAHAIIDALLGAAGLDDIGSQFPDNSDEFKNINSMLLLSRTAELIRKKGFEIEYIDSTVIAQSPKMAPHINNMKINISEALSIMPDLINVKATTEEHLGFTGEKKGIAAHAVCLLK